MLQTVDSIKLGVLFSALGMSVVIRFFVALCTYFHEKLPKMIN